MKPNRYKGFTLIELLVVIAIISLLSSVVLASLNSVRAKGRDARRMSDLKQLAIALDFYYDKYNDYPIDTCNGWETSVNNWQVSNTAQAGYTAVACASGLSSLVSEQFLSKLPTDPINDAIYHFESEEENGSVDVAGVILYVKLEKQIQNQFGCGGSDIYRIRIGNYPNNANVCHFW